VRIGGKLLDLGDNLPAALLVERLEVVEAVLVIGKSVVSRHRR